MLENINLGEQSAKLSQISLKLGCFKQGFTLLSRLDILK